MSTHFPITFKYFLISLCYVKCQNILVNVLVHLLEHLSFQLRCPNFLLSKFAKQLKLIQSVMQVGVVGVYVTSSILRVLLSEFWVSGSQIPSSRDPVPGSWVSGSHVPGSQFQSPGCQDPMSQSHRFPGPGSQGPTSQGLRISGPGFQVLILDYAYPKIVIKYSFFGECLL